MRKPESDANAAKRPKLVGPRDSYPAASPTSASFQPTPVVLVGRMAANSPAHRSPAARLHASRHAHDDSSSLSPPALPLRTASPEVAPAATAHTPACLSHPIRSLSASPLSKSQAVSSSLLVPVPRLRSVAGDSFPLLPNGRLMPLLRAILANMGPPTHPSAFRFDRTPLAAAHYASVLRHFHYDIAKALSAQPFSTLTPGSEFRSSALLAPLL